VAVSEQLVRDELAGHAIAAPMPRRVHTLPRVATDGSTATKTPPATRKRCTRCGETKPLAAFPRDRALCKTCRNGYERERLAGRRERRAAIEDELAPVSGVSITFDELVWRTRARRADLSVVLNDEQRLGRVRLDPDGRYRLVCDAFTPDVVTALSRIGL
jgi:hypothetical protein